jgi:hypothetical protein
VVIAHLRGSFKQVAGASFSFALLLSAGVGTAQAQQLNAAPDGQQFQNQSAATQSDFMGTFGPSCAAQEWVWQHTLAVDPESFSGDPASDGQTFGDQDDDDVQLPFVALFGPRASAEWVTEHNALLGHKILLGTSPVPCPPSKNVAPPAIGPKHLADAVEAADQGDLADTLELFAGFKTIWTAAKPNVMAQSPTLAQTVQDALDKVNALLGDPKAPVPAQKDYDAALKALLRAVNDANSAIAHGTASAGPAAPAGAAAAVAVPQIKAGNLGQSVDAAGKGDLATTRKEFGEFQDDWAAVSDAWHAADDTTADKIDAAIAQLKAVIGDPSQNPPQSQYQPLIQNLQTLVQNANTLAH